MCVCVKDPVYLVKKSFFVFYSVGSGEYGRILSRLRPSAFFFFLISLLFQKIKGKIEIRFFFFSLHALFSLMLWSQDLEYLLE